MHRTATAVLSLALTLGTVTACADQADEVSVTTESGEELVVDWNESETYDQQVEELRLVNEVITKHFGEKVLPRIDGGEWELEEYLDLRGVPRIDPAGISVWGEWAEESDRYRFDIDYDFSQVDGNQQTLDKALAVVEELGLTPNFELSETYGTTADSSPAIEVRAGTEELKRRLIIYQHEEDDEVSAGYETAPSEHESMREAHEASWEGWEPEHDW